MIRNIKDLSKVTLNSQDVMLLVKVKTKKSNGLDLDLSMMNQADKDDSEELLGIEVVGVGSEATHFKIGQLVSVKKNALRDYEALKEDTSERITVVNMVSIAYAVDKDNYEEK